jgi:hypothetical protein
MIKSKVFKPNIIFLVKSVDYNRGVATAKIII